MLQSISWSNYLAGAAALLACYYTVVALLFYRSEIREFLLSRKKALTTQAVATTATADDGTASFEALEDTVHEIDSILDQAGTTATKEQLLPQLKQKLASFGGLRQPAYRVAIYNHIVQQAEEICGVRISVQELEG